MTRHYIPLFLRINLAIKEDPTRADLLKETAQAILEVNSKSHIEECLEKQKILLPREMQVKLVEHLGLDAEVLYWRKAEPALLSGALLLMGLYLLHMEDNAE